MAAYAPKRPPLPDWIARAFECVTLPGCCRVTLFFDFLMALPAERIALCLEE